MIVENSSGASFTEGLYNSMAQEEDYKLVAFMPHVEANTWNYVT